MKNVHVLDGIIGGGGKQAATTGLWNLSSKCESLIFPLSHPNLTFFEKQAKE
jgi:hypothetical protein